MKNSLIVLTLLACLPCYAQLSKVCYDNENNAVDEVASDFCMVGKIVEIPILPGSKETVWHFVDTVRGYFNDTKKMKFLKIYNEHGLEHGNYIEWYADGKVKERGAMNLGRKTGFVIKSYPTGKPNYTLQYFPEDEVVTSVPGNYKILTYFDESGNQIVKGGNGKCDCVLEPSSMREIGKVVNGVRDSIWSAYKGDTLLFMESYHEGKFIDGVRYLDGSSFRYTKFQEPPVYANGNQEMMEIILMNLKYPTNARRMGIEGTVLVTFIITSKGNMEEVRVIQGISGDCDKEAIRVVQLLKNWNPGRQRGKAVNVRFNLPVKFNLN